MKQTILKLSLALVAVSLAPAVLAAGEQQNKMKTCNKEAGDKALKGDERKAFMKECLSAKPAEAAAPAAASDQQSKMKTCNKEAGDKALKGDERKAFMKECLKK
ncbi:PsiF family protein [Zoogloea sp.]|jgi:psiF repeat|uniref:PsiF family protein n=1 Tax=Zoogloea sp. TaxID=49181 RepID=UPI0035B25093|nr:PsiF family protein [Rhodocyclales bacterium]